MNYYLCDQNGNKSESKESLWICYESEKNLSARTKNYTSATEAKPSPLASKIFGFPWVEEMTISPMKILIKRQNWVDFDIIADPLKDLITEHIETQDKLEENPEPQVTIKTKTQGFTQEEKAVADFLDERVNPEVAHHGGRISFVKLQEGALFLKMEGGCQGCGMAQATLREGVETELKKNFSFIKEVIDTTDHSKGLKPYL